MKLFRSIASVVVAAIFAGALFYSHAQGQTVIGAAIQVNQQTGTSYTFSCSPPDAGKLVTFNNSAAIAVTLPRSGTSCFATGWFVYAANVATGTVTITPTTSTIAGGTTLVLTTGTGYLIIGDGSNYQVIGK